jgi:small nuclear ribonucleoprotein (snRNP)-like protein
VTGALVAFAALVAALVGVLVYLVDQRLPTRGRRVVVNLDDGTALRGILTGTRGPWLTLVDADLLRENPSGAATAIRVDGAVYLERPRVLFVQVLP